MFKFNFQPLLEEDDGLNIAGGNGGEVADLQNNDNQNDNAGTGESDNSGVADQKTTQSQDDNAKFAAARREAEKERDEIKAKYERDRNIAKKYGKDYGVFCEEDIAANYADRGIKTLEDLEKAILEEQYRNAGIDPNIINQAIENHPAIKKANEFVSKTAEEKREAAIKSDIDNLHKEFPGVFENIKSEQDIYNDPKWNDLMPLLTQRGYELSDAFYKVYRNDISDKLAKAAAQRQLNNINGKSHIKPDGGGVDVDGIILDENEFKIARGLNPKLTKEDYIKFKKSQKE